MSRHYSVIIPAYNCKKSLQKLIPLLIDQDYLKENFEIIVVDDGSQDGSGDYARSMNVHVITHSKNMGRVAARESGAKAAKNSTLIFLDSRVSILPNMISNASKINHLPLMGVGTSNKHLSIIDRIFYCIRRKVYHPFEPQTSYAKELWLRPGEFDGRPKGLGLFIIEKDMFLDNQLEEKYQDVNDDTKLLYKIVHECAPILRHTDLLFTYEHRHKWKDLLQHTFFRGPKFYDYYLVSGGPLNHHYRILLISITAILSISFLYPLIIVYTFVLTLLGFIAGCVWLAEDLIDFLVCAFFFPAIAISFCCGITFAHLTRLLNLREIIKH